MNSLDKLTQLTDSLPGRYDELDRMFAISIGLMCVAGRDGYFKKVSASWVKLFGWTETEMCSLPWTHYVHPDDVEATIAVAKAKAEGDPIISFINRYRCKDGSYRKLLWNAPGFTSNGLGYSMATDITGLVIS